MSERLASRLPALEWAHRSAAGILEGMGWVDTDLSTDHAPYRQREHAVEGRIFSHLPYTAFLPPPVAEDAVEAQRMGQVPAWEALYMVFARLEWLLASRQYLWTPLSPIPELLAFLVEAFGIDPTLHQRQPAVLARLTAVLPYWHPQLGTVEKAFEILERAESDDQDTALAYLDRDGEIPLSPSLFDEVCACRSVGWWARRREMEAAPQYRISGGFLRFQPMDGGSFVLRREDVLVEWTPPDPLPRKLMRLLPVWTEFRLVVTRSS